MQGQNRQGMTLANHQYTMIAARTVQHPRTVRRIYEQTGGSAYSHERTSQGARELGLPEPPPYKPRSRRRAQP